MTRSKGPAKLGYILDTWFRTACLDAPALKTIANGFSIQRVWQKAVGMNIAKRTRLLKVTGKTLYVTAATSMWMEELKYIKQDIIKKINDELGETAVEEIVFRLGSIIEPENQKSELKNPEHKYPLSQKQIDDIDKLVSRIKDEELRKTIRMAIINKQSMGG